MAPANYRPHSTEPVGNDMREGCPQTQPQHASVALFHHFMPQTRQNLNDRDEYQCHEWQQSSPNQRPYQHEEHTQQYGYQHYYWQQHHERHSPHHETENSQSQQSVGEPQHRSLTLANLSPAAPEVLPAREQQPTRSYNLRSADQVQGDHELPVLKRYVDQPKSLPASTATEAPFRSHRSTKFPNEGILRSPLSSPCSPHKSHSAQDGSVLAGTGSRVRTACGECRLRKIKCDEEVPCWQCQKRRLACDRHEAASAATKEASHDHIPTLQEVRNRLQDLLGWTSTGMQDAQLQKHRYGLGGPATWQDSTRSRRLSLQRRKDEHRTEPHHLIHSCPSLTVLLQAGHIEPDLTNVMETEERPSLCLYPEDEEAKNWDYSQVGGHTGYANHDCNVLGNALSTSTNYCGYNLSGGRPEFDSARQQQYGTGRRKSIDKPSLDAATVEALYESYMQHMHILQPFLDTDEVRHLLDDFIAWHGPPSEPCVAAYRYDTTSDRPTKRQRPDNHSGIAPIRQSRRRRPLGHAIVYLILALGQMCMHSDPLPADSSSISRPETTSSSLGRMYGFESSSLSLEKADTITRKSNQTSSADGGSHSDEGPVTRRAPGLDYYVKAVEIFGVYSDGKDLIHAHLFLLAGLYKGQLARVKESMSWYVMAGRILRQLVRSHGLEDKDHWTWTGEAMEERSQKLITNKHRSSIVRASYSCIQLESDILAELDLPSSGIVSVETMLPMPGTFPGMSSSHDDPAQSANILFHFTSQVYLRIRLNQIHRQLYGPDCEGLSLVETRLVLQEHEAVIGTWQKGLPVGMSWDLEDAPPTDILHARLRAKYWGARYLINRPFLDYILFINPHPNSGVGDMTADSHGKPRREAELHLFRAISKMSKEEVQIGYQTCIKAAEKSTIAFDNVLGRPIVTNIHGTAHA